jgi:uncharacterized protein YdeI (YjbR/CyaY-like superfamily)
MEPRFFATPAEWRRWLARHHRSAAELWVGFHRKATGRPSMTWPEAVDQALCYGWIDGIRKRLDDHSYVIRFTPRRAGSIWSAVNLRRVAELRAGGRMEPAGLAAHAKADETRSAIYAYEQRTKADLPGEMALRFRRNRAAWAFFQAQPPSYRHTATWWVISARRADTRERRLATLIGDSAAGRRIRHLARP